MIETKLAQIAASIPVNNEGNIPRQLENSLKKVNVVTTRGGKSTRDPPYPNHKAGKTQGNKRANLHHQQKHKKIKKKRRKRHRKTSSTPVICRFPQEIESKPWTSNSLVLLR